MVKGSTALVLVVVLVVVLLMSRPSSSTAAPPAARDPSYGPFVDWSLHNPPAATSGSSGSLTDSCHQAFVAGTGAVVGKYGAGGAAELGAKSNPYYYACDAGGLVVKGAKAVYENTLGRIF